MQLPNIVILGHVCIDHNTTEHASYTHWGSSVLYIAQYLQARYLAVPLVVSNYGPDILPYLPVVDMLPDRPTKEKTLLYENNTRSTPRVWKAHHTQYAVPPDLTPEIIAALAKADIIIVATLLPNYDADYIKELLSYAKPHALKVLCPQGYFRHIQADGLVAPQPFAEAASIVQGFNLIIFSEEDTPEAFTVAQEWQRIANPPTVVVTQGANGASIVQKDKTLAIPTTPLTPEEIIDSVGCGDTFAATVAYEYYRSRDLPQAVEAAHEAARRKLLETPNSMTQGFTGS